MLEVSDNGSLQILCVGTRCTIIIIPASQPTTTVSTPFYFNYKQGEFVSLHYCNFIFIAEHARSGELEQVNAVADD